MSTRELYAKSRPYKGGLMVAGEGFEPSKAEPGDLQSPPIGRSGNPPGSNSEAACVDYLSLRGAGNSFFPDAK